MSVVASRVPQRSWDAEWRAARAVCRRELIRFLGNRPQILMALIQPLLFLFVLGSGLDSLAAGSSGGVDLTTFVFPGVLGMTVLFSAIFNAATLVWDRELGFLRELLVAPVSRASILAGKCLGGAVIATGQGIVVLALAGLVGVPYDPLMLLGLLALMLLLALSVTAFGILIAVSIKQPQSFTSLMQLVVMPMFFASGAFFPVSGLPGWLEVVNRLNPMTYAVDPMRHLVFAHLDGVSETARRTLDPGVTWFGWEVPTALEVLLVAAIGAVVLALAARRFNRTP